MASKSGSIRRATTRGASGVAARSKENSEGESPSTAVSSASVGRQVVAAGPAWTAFAARPLPPPSSSRSSSASSSCARRALADSSVDSSDATLEASIGLLASMEA